MTTSMRFLGIGCGVCILLVAAVPAVTGPKPVDEEATVANDPPSSGNLLENGDFETPDPTKSGPARWQKMDGLVYRWTTDPKAPARGKVLRIDTSVDEAHAVRWWVDRYVRDRPLDRAPQKVAGSGYSHVGGNIGGFCWSSHFIPVKPGGAYRVYVDARGPAGKVFIRGYEKKVPVFFGDEQPLVQQVFREARGDPTHDENGRPIRYRLRFRYQSWIPVGGSDEWKTYTHRKPRHPNGNEITEDVRFIRIMLYPYWPPGEYWFDNVRVVEVEDSE
ncbi:MAG: hypothetical protein CMJ84_14530 [Planctomycetes bacterium]|nr:hypothetical protein [Planctomycetota bacterium]